MKGLKKCELEETCKKKSKSVYLFDLFGPVITRIHHL